MKNKYYKELGNEYGENIYDTLNNFVSVDIFTNEGDGVLKYDKTIIAYPHYMVDFSKDNMETVEMIDVINGQRYPLISNNNVGKMVFSKKHVKKIDENLFNLEMKKDSEGKAAVFYDVTNFGKTIKQMENFITTTYGLSRLDEFQKIALTKEEIELEKKKMTIMKNESYLNYIKFAPICFVLRMDKPTPKSRRKDKMQLALLETHVPVMVIDGIAYDLRGNNQEYPILNYQVKQKSRFSLFNRVELDDSQYDQMYLDLSAGLDKHYIDGWKNIKPICLEDVLNLSNDELKNIVNNAKEILEQKREKKLAK